VHFVGLYFVFIIENAWSKKQNKKKKICTCVICWFSLLVPHQILLTLEGVMFNHYPTGEGI